MKKCIVDTFKGSDGKLQWRCRDPKFLVSTAHSIGRRTCAYYKCPERQDIIGVDIPKCAWKDCTKAVAPNKLRHCSEVCRKRDNRHQYKVRQKLKEALLKNQISES